MLSAGFSTVTWLKSRLLPTAATDDTDHDDTIAALGRSVAGQFDRFCGRDFARAAGATDTFNARATAWVLTRYPVEEIASVVVRAPGGGSIELDAGEWQIDEVSGVLETVSIAGSRLDKIVITYTGGYWPDPRDGTVMPAEANALPADVLEAWVAQCQHEAESRGLFNAVSLRAQKDESEPRTAALGLLDHVAEILNPHRRFGGE